MRTEGEDDVIEAEEEVDLTVGTSVVGVEGLVNMIIAEAGLSSRMNTEGLLTAFRIGIIVVRQMATGSNRSHQSQMLLRPPLHLYPSNSTLPISSIRRKLRTSSHTNSTDTRFSTAILRSNHRSHSLGTTISSNPRKVLLDRSQQARMLTQLSSRISSIRLSGHNHHLSSNRDMVGQLNSKPSSISMLSLAPVKGSSRTIWLTS